MRKFSVSVPGKVILHGEHAVVYGKAAVATSIDLRTVVECSLDCRMVILDLKDFSCKFSWSLAEFETLQSLDVGDGEFSTPSDDLLKSLCVAFDLRPDSKCYQSIITFLFLYTSIACKKAKGKWIPAEFSVTSALPIGAGLGSSAAYSVAVTASVLRLYGALDAHPDNHGRSLVSQWAYQAEVILHGRPSGIDNTICTHGGALLFKKGKIVEMNNSMPLYKILLVNTKVPRNTKSLVASVREKVERYPEVVTPVFDSVENISLQCWNLLKNADNNPQQLFRNASDLISMNHHLMNFAGVGHPQLDAVTSLASRLHLSAKLTGAGGGGCAFVLLSIGDAIEESESQLDKEKQLFKQLQQMGFECWSVTMGCNGVTFDD